MVGASLVYAPGLLPDELLYSWLARVAALNALGPPRDALERLFGCRTFVPSVDLPTRLQLLADGLGKRLPNTSLDDLLEAGTLLPYHRPFLTANTNLRVRHHLLHGNAKGLKSLMGRVANRFGAHPALRSCPVCLIDSWKHHGSAYWMRKHQLPGVTCCLDHGIMLNSTPLRGRTDRQRLLLPRAAPESQHVKCANPGQIRFAQLSQELVAAALPALVPMKRSAAYRAAALANGYGAGRRGLNFPAVAEALRRRFDDFNGFEHCERLRSSAAQPLAWVRPLFDKPERALHPICHLLLIELLFGSVSAFQAACEGVDMPPPCASLTENPPPQDLECHGVCNGAFATAYQCVPAVHHIDHLLDASLSCHEVARLTGISVTTVVARRRARAIPIRERRKSLTESVIDKVLHEIGLQSSLKAVAAHTGISLSSVYRILRQHPTTARPVRDGELVAQAPMRRMRWTAALQAGRMQGPAVVKAARARAAADFAWLYRHDRAWLAATTREFSRISRGYLPAGAPASIGSNVMPTYPSSFSARSTHSATKRRRGV